MSDGSGLKPPSPGRIALDYARRGFHVFPIEGGTKDRPLCKWSRDATTHEPTIRRWWSKWPDANIGIATGPSGLLVVDVDQKTGKDGAKSLGVLQAMCDQLPTTLTVRTAANGQHIFFRGAARNSVCKLGHGLIKPHPDSG
jgi:hypothetical protein